MANHAKYPCDMHTHTNRSDGNDTPQELIENAVRQGLKVLTLADHDVLPPETIHIDGKPTDPIQHAANLGLCFIPGVEFSCDSNNDDVHIVAIGCDHSDPLMKKAEKMAVESKVSGYRKLTQILVENDIHVTWEDILENQGQRRQPHEVQRKHIFEAIANKGYASSWSDAKLMVRENPKFNVKREKYDPLWILDIIHRTGGLAILAHPYLIDEQVIVQGQKISRKDYISRLIDAGLDGIEACYTYEKTSYKGSMSREEIEKEVRSEYEGKLPIISGGSDYHNDGKKGVENPRQLGEAGITLEYFLGNECLKRFSETVQA